MRKQSSQFSGDGHLSRLSNDSRIVDNGIMIMQQSQDKRVPRFLDQHKSSGQFEVFRGTQFSHSNVSHSSANFGESSFAKEITKGQIQPYANNQQ